MAAWGSLITVPGYEPPELVANARGYYVPASTSVRVVANARGYYVPTSTSVRVLAVRILRPRRSRGVALASASLARAVPEQRAAASDSRLGGAWSVEATLLPL